MTKTELIDEFRQMAISQFGAEPGIEGYSANGTYGFGWNSDYGKELAAKKKGGCGGKKGKAESEVIKMRDISGWIIWRYNRMGYIRMGHS